MNLIGEVEFVKFTTKGKNWWDSNHLEMQEKVEKTAAQKILT